MKSIIVFVGPSLGGDVRPRGGRIRLAPPARCGDMLRALRSDVAAMALVDGSFETAPTVWHKEIMAVMDAGVPVYGAASLGALRAAELDQLGMIGVGRIYEAYRDGEIESDAAVMVSHAPAELGHRPLTLALVDAEASLAAARLPPDERAALCKAARLLNFRARTWSAILAGHAARFGRAAADAAASAIRNAAFSQKARDVAALLDRLDSDLPVAAKPSFDLPRTIFLERLLNSCRA